jgi:dihydropteroate synthase
MGIVNVTPDSFSDGGLFLDPDAAVEHGLELAEEGADILDVGGASTRPGAEPVPADVELRRALPVVERLAAAGRRVSIDTKDFEVAVAALAAGATMALAIFSFELNPAGPVLVTLAGLVAGGLAIHEARDWLVRALGYGLVAGSLLTILFWPFFDVGA